MRTRIETVIDKREARAQKTSSKDQKQKESTELFSSDAWPKRISSTKGFSIGRKVSYPVRNSQCTRHTWLHCCRAVVSKQLSITTTAAWTQTSIEILVRNCSWWFTRAAEFRDKYVDGGLELNSSMSFASKVKYSPLSDLEADDGSAVLDIKAMDKKNDTFSFDSIYSYSNDKKHYGSEKNAFNSVFKYNNMTAGRQRGHLAIDVREDGALESKPSGFLVATSYILTFLSYLFLVVTLPISYWIFVKKLGEFDRLVVFRLGKMIGVKGPGRVIIFPWMDRTKKVDVRAAAFSVPPQQFITCDGGIIEMGAEIQYGIVDVGKTQSTNIGLKCSQTFQLILVCLQWRWWVRLRITKTFWDRWARPS